MDYYAIAGEASKIISGHPGLEYLKDICKKHNKILDLGCGEGSRLETLLGPKKSGWGIDINNKAILKAKIQYPHHQFLSYSGNILPYQDNFFDLVYTAFVLEHTQNPTIFLKEMIRVCRKGGMMVILCPNFGAPNRRSPVSREIPVKKLIYGIKNDFMQTSKLNWQKVTPKKKYVHIDDDTTVEPYLKNLLSFLSRNKLKIIKYSSLWELESASLNPRKLLFKLLGKANIYPFKYWGPQIFISAVKY